ncbi:sugar ABC transporter permease [Caldimonas thermodepolymerans]|jgi:ABC-type xylose transport system, permease component|uniref:Xylose transport system permease protein XylH n=1 Tax=Caldimonas thermodepolymerans TaxID=215580 RepID=A0A2S5T168_9BURK|nr:multiple monosaccharide ABC transporter permease [Caldimonas thermodepolymerans]PPE68696.1 ABC transporter permease [Caldimonas thermodepolymerans]QPC31532.1 sugar ABC transporter permease [Caldimonas thermodepolymerans]RDH95118.1 multiple monosaccharide ABC transporter membrane protein [Caldimonas thermodepolymerans]TCP03257.1 multiple monosaccharide ABC transporter membrane protein [Caldimonas thermodepolymerans]UZG44285.1 sugar ABC transporter permease [Caldimonas thermodepolymerans]
MSEQAIAEGSAAPLPKSYAGFLKHNVREYGMLLSLVLIMIFFQVMTDGTLMQPLNLTNLVLQNSYIVIMALGMLLVIVCGHIDLSVGSVCGFIGALAAVLMVRYDVHFVPATLLCLLAGAVIGGIQGSFVAFLRIPSFIVTLAGMLVFKGLALAVLQGQSLGPFPETFQRLSSGFIPDPFGGESLRIGSLLLGMLVAAAMVWSRLRERRVHMQHGMEEEPWGFFVAKTAVFAAAILFLCYLMASYRGLPNVLIVMFALMLAYDFVTQRTTLGRRFYALGGNEKAARLSGIKTERLTFLAFVNMGVLAALAGLVFAARLNTATPKAGLGFELDVIAACFIGGASASGGVGKVMGAVIGAFVMGVMNNGMSILGIGIDYQQVIKGLVLLAAVCVDVYNKNRS